MIEFDSIVNSTNFAYSKDFRVRVHSVIEPRSRVKELEP